MLRETKYLPLWMLVISLSALLFCTQAVAQTDDTASPMFTFNGFGTAGLAHSSERNADFMLSNLQAKGAGYSQSWSPEVDSRIGVQLNAQFNRQLSAVLQVASEQRHDGTYRPQVEWANVKYQFTPDFSMRVGRMVFPAFLVSDYRKVGYATHWVRPPLELYDLFPVTDTDGISFSHHSQVGRFHNSLQFFFSQSSEKLPNGMTVTGKNGIGISNMLGYGPTTLHASYFRSNQEFKNADQFDSLFAAYRQLGSAGVAIADKYEVIWKTFSDFYSWC